MHGMPQPDENVKKLHRLAGRWHGPEQLQPSPWGPGGPAYGHIEARVALDGMFVVSDYVEEKNGQVVFRGHGVFGWNAQLERFTWHWFDVMGMPPHAPALGTWTGDTLVFENEFPQGRARYTYVFDGDDRYRFKIENGPHGAALATFVEATYSRSGSAAAVATAAAAGARRPRVHRTSSSLIVADLQRSLDFWCNVLGFTDPGMWGEPPCFAMANRDGHDIMLTRAAGDATVRPNGPAGVWDVYIRVADARAEADALRAKGVTLTREPSETFYEMVECEVTDPDGYRICFGSEMSS